MACFGIDSFEPSGSIAIELLLVLVLSPSPYSKAGKSIQGDK